MEPKKIYATLTSEGEQWFIVINDPDDATVHIACESVEAFATAIEELNGTYEEEISVVWRKDVGLKPEHFDAINTQMATYKEE
jgi:hypothetical protein